MATYDDVILAHQKAIAAAITAAGVTASGDILDGLPTSDDVISSVRSGAGKSESYIVSIYGNTVSSNATRYAPITIYPNYPAPTVPGSPVSAPATTAVAKVAERIQVTVWTQTASLRSQIYEAIMAYVGTPINRVLDCANGESCYTLYANGPRKVDESVGDSMIKRADLFFDAEYDLTFSGPSTQILSGEADISVANLTEIKLAPIDVTLSP